LHAAQGNTHAMPVQQNKDVASADVQQTHCWLVSTVAT
jgi:hypothetical protein